MKNRKKDYITIILAAAFWAVNLIIGYYHDYDIAVNVYSENNMAAVIISAAASFFFYGSFVFFLGVLCRQLVLSVEKTYLKCLIVIIYTVFALTTSTYGASGFLSDSVCGFLIKNNTHSITQYITAGLITLLPFYPLGILANGKRRDKAVVRDLIIILSVLTAALFFSNIVKGWFMRPRYRITLLGYDSIGFVPCFSAFTDGRELKETYSLVYDDLASFFSGHAMHSMLAIMILPAYRYVFTKLKGKENALTGIALIISLPIAFSRMVLGDHYLSDISAGAIAGLIFCAIYYLLSAKAAAYHNT